MNVQKTQDLTPRVWIGCLACYNAGYLVGEWFDAEEAHSITLAQVHSGTARTGTGCEELWCFDTENIPVDRELSPHEATQWGEVFAEVDEHLWPALHAWVNSGTYTAQNNSDLPVTSEFIDSYMGEHESFTSFVQESFDETGFFTDVPELVQRYFDWERFARDEVHNYTVCETSGGVLVFTA